MSSSHDGPGGADASRETTAQRIWNIDPDSLTEADVQQLMTAAVKAYGRLLDESHGFLPVRHGEICATDALRTVSALLEAADLETFELALWQAWGNGPRAAGVER